MSQGNEGQVCIENSGKKMVKNGGLTWNRTRDLTLIRRAL